MPLCLTLCILCTKSRPEFARMVARLKQEHPDDLEVVELRCMAACDDVPAVMIETDYFPKIAPIELKLRVETLLTHEA